MILIDLVLKAYFRWILEKVGVNEAEWVNDANR
jgi:hypothetical protein